MKTSTEQLVLRALESTKAILTEPDYREVFEYNAHREWGIAAELLADILTEKESALTRCQFEAIQFAFEAMMMADSPRLVDLKKQILK
jgi:hypothetical protein